jgi:hypothetical protein
MFDDISSSLGGARKEKETEQNETKQENRRMRFNKMTKKASTYWYNII